MFKFEVESDRIGHICSSDSNPLDMVQRIQDNYGGVFNIKCNDKLITIVCDIKIRKIVNF